MPKVFTIWKVVIVDPDAPLEVALVVLYLLGVDIEDVGVQLVFLLLAKILDVVLRNFVAGEDEGHALFDVFEVLAGHGDTLQGVLRSVDHVFDAAPAVVEKNVDHRLVLAIDHLAVQGLHYHALPPRVLFTRFLELLFLGGKFVNDFVDGNLLRLVGNERPLAAIVGDGDDCESGKQTNTQTDNDTMAAQIALSIHKQPRKIWMQFRSSKAEVLGGCQPEYRSILSSSARCYL